MQQRNMCSNNATTIATGSPGSDASCNSHNSLGERCEPNPRLHTRVVHDAYYLLNIEWTLLHGTELRCACLLLVWLNLTKLPGQQVSLHFAKVVNKLM